MGCSKVCMNCRGVRVYRRSFGWKGLKNSGASYFLCIVIYCCVLLLIALFINTEVYRIH